METCNTRTFLTSWLLRIGSSCLAAGMLALAWVNIALAAGGGDGDGFDGNEIIWPLLVLGGLVLLGGFIFFATRFRRKPLLESRNEDR